MIAVRDTEPGWKFVPKTKDDMAVDPIQDEFFKTESVGGFSNALLRETIQNSLDAKAGMHQEVRIRISIVRGDPPMGDKKYGLFFSGLTEHLNASGNGLIDRPASKTPLDFLVIEDFNTTGLEGDPLLGDYPKDETSKENFYYFWRNYGRSGKFGEERGRWGLGKTVFSAVSKINTFFGFTIRKSDQRPLIMGQSVLKIHSIGQDSFLPYGRFGFFNDFEGERYFPVPIEEPALIQEFTGIFHISRTTEPGLSLVIPFPYEDISLQSLKAGIIKEFFYPIISGDLSVIIQENGNSIGLDRESVNQLITNGTFLTSDFDGETEDVNLIKLFSFAKTAIRMGEEEYICLTPPADLTCMPGWHDSLFEGVSLDRLRKKFDQCEVIGFKIPIKVQKTGQQQPKLNWFKAFVQRDGTLHEAENYFIREGIRISSVISFRERGIRGMVVIDEGELTTLIGDSENPAHTEWQRNSSKFRNKYKHGSKTLDFVKASLREIIRRLMKPPVGVDTEALKDVFYFDLTKHETPEELPKKTKDKEEKGERPGNGPDLDVVSRVKPVLLSKISGGVRISHNPVAERPVSSVEIRFAYGVRKGNPFKKYQTADFDLAEAPIKIGVSGLEITGASENILKADVTDQDFELTITGFDELRDLIVQSKYSEVSE